MALLVLAAAAAAAALGEPCLRWHHNNSGSAASAAPTVDGRVAVIESASGLREVVALLANGTVLSYSISISGAEGPRVDLAGAAGAEPVVFGRGSGGPASSARLRRRSASSCWAASSQGELVAVVSPTLPSPPGLSQAFGGAWCSWWGATSRCSTAPTWQNAGHER